MSKYYTKSMKQDALDVIEGNTFGLDPDRLEVIEELIDELLEHLYKGEKRHDQYSRQICRMVIRQ